jgi:hypothetical protein
MRFNMRFNMLDNTMRHAYGVLTCLMLGPVATVAHAQSVAIPSANSTSSSVAPASTLER